MGDDDIPPDKVPEDYQHHWRWWVWLMCAFSVSIIMYDTWVAAEALANHHRLWVVLTNGIACAVIWFGNRTYLRDGVFRLAVIGRPSMCGRVRLDTPRFGSMVRWTPFVRKRGSVPTVGVCITPNGHTWGNIVEKRYSRSRATQIQRVFEHKIAKLSPGAYVEVPASGDRDGRNFRIWFHNSAAAVEFKLRYSDEFDLL